MGDLIDLATHRSRRPASAGPRVGVEDGCLRAPATVELFFDLASPWTYLVAERADRSLRSIHWQPVLTPLALGTIDAVAVERRADELGMPFAWPDARWGGGRPAMRVAQHAAAHGRGASFATAFGRLVYCGGFDVDDPEVIAEAAAAAHLDVDEALAVSGETARDAALLADGQRLLERGATALPAFGLGATLLSGERTLGAVVAAARHAQLVTSA